MQSTISFASTSALLLLLAAVLVTGTMAEPNAAEYKDTPSSYGGDVSPVKDYKSNDAGYKPYAGDKDDYSGDKDDYSGVNNNTSVDKDDYSGDKVEYDAYGNKKPCPPKVGGADVSTYGDRKDTDAYGSSDYPEGDYSGGDRYPEGDYPEGNRYPVGDYPEGDYPEAHPYGGDYPDMDGYRPVGDYPHDDYRPMGAYPRGDYPEGPVKIIDTVYGPGGYGGAGGRPFRRPRRRVCKCDNKRRRQQRRQQRRRRPRGANDRSEDQKAYQAPSAYPTKPANVDDYSQHQQPSAYPEGGAVQPKYEDKPAY